MFLKGRGSWVYPNVGAAGCTLTSGQPCAAWSGQEVSRASPSRLALRARGLLYELVQYNLYKKCTNCMNLYYTICICMNLYYTICIKNVRIIWIRMYDFVQKLVKKKRNQVGISTRDQYGLQCNRRSGTPSNMNLYYTICICMNLYYTICIKNVRIIWIRMYEFVQKLAKKKKKKQVWTWTWDQYGLQSSQLASSRKKIAVKTVILMVPDLCFLEVLWYQKMWGKLLTN